ncbi:AbrB family transcriptional regulator [Halobacteriales archaeon SW_7_68_16]|nr:MAG: AbrB family transcriptional regulator [Halobacteriales archaeon SW_7_68_16]
MSTDGDPDSETTRITRKGQVTIPKKFREEFGLEPGDEVVWQTGDDGIVVRKVNRASARGMLIPDDTPPEKREEIAEELERRVHEHRESIEADLADEDA